jgi:YVTN family beta-propeller protein
MLKKCLLLILLALQAAALHAQTVAYVANNIDGAVEVINTSTNAVVATITGFSHPSDLAVSPNGALLYVYTASSQIAVVNTATNTIAASIGFPLGASSEGAGPAIAFNPDGQFAYVANSIGNLTVIDTQSSSVAQIVPLPAGFGPVAVAVSPDGNTVYVSSGNGQGILVLNANTFATVATIANGHLIDDLAISPNGSTLYGSDESGFIGGISGVLVVDTATNTVAATVPLPFSSADPSLIAGVAVTPDGLHVYVEDFFFRDRNSTVSVINTSDNSIAATIPANGLNLTNLVITPDGSTALALNEVISTTSDSSLAEIPTATNTIANTITVGRGGDGLATLDMTPPGVTSSIAANFNGTAVPSGDALWFSAVTKVSGLGSSPVNIFISNSTITFSANGATTTVPVPNVILTFDPNATTATTTFNVALNQWRTTVPSSGLAGNVFLDGQQLPLPSGLPGGIQNVTWSASFSTDTPGVSLHWQWAAAAYTSLDLNCSSDPPSSANLNCLGVKPVDDNRASQYQNSDHAGTPENSKTYVVGGATGGGGSNFTGGLSGTKSVTPTLVP